MDIMSIIGLLGCIGFIGFGILNSGELINFYNATSIYIVVGGTFTALMITFPLKVFREIPKQILKLFSPQEFNPLKYVKNIVQIADDIRKSGFLSQEDKIAEYKDDFLRKGIQLTVDSTDSEMFRDIMETELIFMMERHKLSISFFEKGAALASGFGMIGTLVILVNMLAGMVDGDSSFLISNMGIALITTFYGAMMANVLFIPAANKLAQRSDDEVLCKQIAIEGLILIINRENPRQIEEKLLSYIPPAMRIEKNSRRGSTSVSEE